MLEIRDIETSYGKIAALKGVTLDVHEGALTCLLGPNGAGKTTLIWTIAGILRAHAGSMKLAGTEIRGMKPHQIVAQGIVTVPENRLVFPDMTVRDNLIAGAFSRRKDGSAVMGDLEAVLTRFPRLRERSGQMAGTLSGGEQQMLAVGRALMARPRVLLMDEPSTGLAPIIVEEIFEIIGQLRDEGRTIFLVEQNAHMALKYADRFYLLEQGRVTFSGKPGEVDQDEVIHRAYLGARKAKLTAMGDFVQNIADGVAAGASYALLAIGFTLIFGVMRRLNIAFGSSIMVGVFLGAWVHAQWSAGLWAAAAATFVGAALASAYVERLSFAAIRADAAVASMASSFALWMQLEQGVALAFPGRTTPFPALTGLPDVELAGILLRGDAMLVLLVAVIVLVALWHVLYRTRFGLQMRALADSPEAARVARVNTARVAFLTFILASAIGAVAGVLIAASDGQISPKFGLWATMKGLVAMMIGGLGSLRGALLGGLALGVIEAQAQWYLGAAEREMVVYGLLFLCLILLPGGLARVRDTGAERKL